MSRKAENIARMDGKTTYRDFREGFAAVPLTRDSDADIKAALGMTQRRVGVLAVQALEMRYASMLRHERALRRAWERKLATDAAERKHPRTSHTMARQRMASALAIRQFAGARMIQHEVADFAWLACCRRSALEDDMQACGAWLDELCHEAETVFLEVLDVIRPRRKHRAA